MWCTGIPGRAEFFGAFPEGSRNSLAFKVRGGRQSFNILQGVFITLSVMNARFSGET